MKIALFSDLHGNHEAFQAIISDIEKQQVDLTVCAGDAVDPFPESGAIWLEIRQRNIPMVLGNHEEYVISYHDPAHPLGMRDKVRYLPVSVAARSLSGPMIADIAKLPLTLNIPGPNGDDVLVCHASPSNTRRSFARRMDDEMVADLRQFPQRTIASGHIHETWRAEWEGKLLFLCGGGGLPLQGQTVATYALLTHTSGNWQLEHRQINYNHAGMLRYLREDGFLEEAGPIGILFYDELWTAERRMIPFFKFTGQDNIPDTRPGVTYGRTPISRINWALGLSGAVGQSIGSCG